MEISISLGVENFNIHLLLEVNVNNTGVTETVHSVAKSGRVRCIYFYIKISPSCIENKF
jgi:hypothetical protein